MPNWGSLCASFDGADYMRNVATQKFNSVSSGIDEGADQVMDAVPKPSIGAPKL